jgi:hypothetical protein
MADGNEETTAPLPTVEAERTRREAMWAMAGPRELTRVEWESIINGCGRSVSRIWSARRGGQPGLELTDDGAEHAGSEQPRPEWT